MTPTAPYTTLGIDKSYYHMGSNISASNLQSDFINQYMNKWAAPVPNILKGGNKTRKLKKSKKNKTSKRG